MNGEFKTKETESGIQNEKIKIESLFSPYSWLLTPYSCLSHLET